MMTINVNELCDKPQIASKNKVINAVESLNKIIDGLKEIQQCNGFSELCDITGSSTYAKKEVHDVIMSIFNSDITKGNEVEVIEKAIASFEFVRTMVCKDLVDYSKVVQQLRDSEFNVSDNKSSYNPVSTSSYKNYRNEDNRKRETRYNKNEQNNNKEGNSTEPTWGSSNNDKNKESENKPSNEINDDKTNKNAFKTVQDKKEADNNIPEKQSKDAYALSDDSEAIENEVDNFIKDLQQRSKK